MTNKTANLLDLMSEAATILDGNADASFTSAVQGVVLILKASEALPFMRSSANGYSHTQLAAALVLAYQRGVDVMLPTRKAQTLFDMGYSTCLLSWLDRSVAAGALISNSPDKKAKGPLKLGPMITDYLDNKAMQAA